ncbi:hypothetical protein FA10DRAFT_265016 [Acaromyces ingoldii]|uniref:CMP/dCMP-type deaminase domain-containing protein n=1 Tax=Acaromyces ingoldii TaxID=215250 RepID=A0A316YR44_9BASI|nr:hypothetical protein FA10DRAFT_265016 [Acaromyces ingoldii]PWN91138.1 hypothetical protein FA10DRAFT_265016 [Acaromyces ingoldii]
MSPVTTMSFSNKRADRILSAATNEAVRSEQRSRHGAIITKGGKILAAGHNHIRPGFSGPLANAQNMVKLFEAHGDPPPTSRRPPNRGSHVHAQHCFSMHAEMHAITSALNGAKPSMTKSNFDFGGALAPLQRDHGAASSSSSSASAGKSAAAAAAASSSASATAASSSSPAEDGAAASTAAAAAGMGPTAAAMAATTTAGDESSTKVGERGVQQQQQRLRRNRQRQRQRHGDVNTASASASAAPAAAPAVAQTSSRTCFLAAPFESLVRPRDRRARPLRRRRQADTGQCAAAGAAAGARTAAAGAWSRTRTGGAAAAAGTARRAVAAA